MNWKRTLTELITAGMTQGAIAKAIGVTQSAISQVLRDQTGRRGFRYEAGCRLVELHRDKCLGSAPEGEVAGGQPVLSAGVHLQVDRVPTP